MISNFGPLMPTELRMADGISPSALPPFPKTPCPLLIDFVQAGSSETLFLKVAN